MLMSSLKDNELQTTDQDLNRPGASDPQGSEAERHRGRCSSTTSRRRDTGVSTWTEDYASGAETPDEGDPFPELGLEVDQSELTGPLLVSQRVNMHMVNGKALYKLCVQALNKRQLSGRRDTVWRERLAVQEDCKPVWRVLYKAPLNKRSGDLQWRILQGALAVNCFISKINPTTTFMSIVLFAGTPLNFVVLLVTANYKKLRVPLNFILVNISFA
ncbi:hypothetical protein L3Q82_009186 [Scortum barcoo]|uniref:Uncharacterized protein n=1 Tax=Scortum barcoo TaxID=214431 RepID=A0ACB8WEW0_9TELE|nr:hypothetical protein L3Q82_009186 [Scortum barcoo]